MASSTQATPSSEAPSLDPAGISFDRVAMFEQGIAWGRRLAWALFTLLAIAYVAFAGLEMARGVDPLSALGIGFEHLSQWLARLLQGDLGMTSSASAGARPVPVSEVLGTLVFRSVGLMLVSFLLTLAVGIPLGALTARYRHSNVSLLTLVLSLLGASLPSFFIALVLQLLVIGYARRSGGPAPLPVGGFGWDLHLVLPALVLAARPVAQVARVTYLSLAELLGEDFVRTARAKGLSERAVWQRHVYRNAAIPILTTLVTSLRFALSSLPVVELYFGWPGVGFNLLRAIGSRDDNLTVPLLLSLGILFIAINWMVDALYPRLDPRLKEQSRARLAHLGGLAESLSGVYYGLRDALQSLLTFRRTPAQEDEHTFRGAIKDLADAKGLYEVDEAERRRERRQAWIRGTVRNLPLILGGLIVIGLLFVVAAGPRLWPDNPYLTRGLVIEGGEFKVPPFPPSGEFLWGTDALGRDILSLVLAGAYQTLSIVLAVVLVRVLTGLILGAFAGWTAGSTLDRMVMGLAELLSAFPALILAMLVITALGIRNGPWVFVVALGFVGWGEIMQYVRAQVISIRPRAYIESALSVGLRVPELLFRHVLPNLLSALIALSVLEVGAILMLLGELGFIGIFIGGGAFAELQIDAPAYHYSDVPEWGALLANIRTYARAYPWTALYPSLAFVISILGFNLLGEGLRRMIDSVGVAFGRLLNRRTFLVLIVLLLAVRVVSARTGPLALYAGESEAFDGELAYEHVAQLAAPAMQGRRLDTPQATAAADYIAEQFKAVGLQPAGDQFSYFQTRNRDFAYLSEVPKLALYNQDISLRPLQYRQDFNVFYQADRNLGAARAPVMFVGFGRLRQVGSNFVSSSFPAMRDQDFSNEILLLLDPNELTYLRNVARQGVLVVAPSGLELDRYTLYSARNPISRLFGTGRRFGEESPVMWISEDTADLLLAASGVSVDRLRRIVDDLPEDGIAKLPTGIEAEMNVAMNFVERAPARNIIGHLPGLDATLDGQMIMVMAQYDGLGVGPDGAIYPGANDNAAAVGVMLELLRAWQEVGYQPNRTFLFVAYSGEGYETGQDPSLGLDVETFLKAKQGFSTAFDLEAIVFLRGLGAGEVEVLQMNSGGNLRLSNLFASAARRAGLKTRVARDEVDLRVLFSTRQRSFVDSGGEVAPTITLGYQGWDRYSGLPADTLDTIDPQWLALAGRTLSTGLMVMGQELRY